jgi:predicted nuclease with RNAse H fold
VTRALGIDVGIDKGLDVVLLGDSLTPEHVASRVGLDRLRALIDDLTPDAIGIDAPPSWAPAGRSRLTERLLAELNIHAFNTPSASHGKASRFYEWMQVGFRVFGAAEEAGYPRYRAGDPRRTAMEVFPHGSAAVLAGCLPPKGVGKRAWRTRVLAAHGVSTTQLSSADRVDAALCALTALLALNGKRFAPGDPKEGVIVLPASSLPAKPFRPAPPDAADESTVPLFRECACGDPTCHELTRTEFAKGHDAKRKSMLWRQVRAGVDASDELRSRGWAVPPEAR